MWLRSRVDALRAAQLSLEESVAEADREHFTARQQRNDARERVRKQDETIHRLEERLARVEEELQVARDDLHSAQERAREAGDRLSRVQESSWWQARDIVLDVRRRPGGVVLLPGRLRRLRRRGGG